MAKVLSNWGKYFSQQRGLTATSRGYATRDDLVNVYNSTGATAKARATRNNLIDLIENIGLKSQADLEKLSNAMHINFASMTTF